MALQKNLLTQLTVTAVTGEGSGVARYIDEDIPAPGVVVFIPGTAVGDTILCRIVKVLKNHAFGKVEELLTPSSDRCADLVLLFSNSSRTFSTSPENMPKWLSA